MYNSNTDLLGLILDVEVFFSLGHCSGALCKANTTELHPKVRQTCYYFLMKYIDQEQYLLLSDHVSG